MKEIELASQVDLTLHLGLMAIAITLILWRVSDSKQVYDQIKAFHEYCRSGYANSAIIKELRFKWFQVYLKIITIFVSLGIFHFSFKYLKILE